MSIYGLDLNKPIHEAYIGETKELKKIQETFSKFRSKYVNDNSYSSKINTDDDLYKFNRLIEEFFGFGCFSLDVFQDPSYNAFTIPIDYRFDVVSSEKNMFSTKNGFKFVKEADYACVVCIHSGLIQSSKFTDREVLAIILHEIGHNFASNIDKKLVIFNTVSKVLRLTSIIELCILAVTYPLAIISAYYQTIMSFNCIQSIIAKSREKAKKENKEDIEKGEKINIIFSLIDTFKIEKSMLKTFKNIITGELIPSDKVPILVDNNITISNFFSTFFNYNNEKIADNFATMYGYGADVSSALAKMEYSDGGRFVSKAVNTIPLFSALYNLAWLPVEIVSTGFNCHPSTPARMKNQLKYLKAEINKDDLDPKLKIRLQDDIDKLNETVDNNLFTYKQKKLLDHIKDPYLFNRVYACFMYTLFGGDLREVLSTSNNNKKIDTAIEKNKR